MKSGMKVVFACALLLGMSACSSQSDCPVCEPDVDSVVYEDAYTSASSTKSWVEGTQLDEVRNELMSISSDLASLADTQVEGYTAPENEKVVQIMSVNPDGCVGFSTIHAWKYEAGEEFDRVHVELTRGQNALNLAKIGKRGTLLAHGEGAYYLIHFETEKVAVLEYSDEAFGEGKFNSAYSGAKNQLEEYSLTLKVLGIESTYAAMFQ